MRSVGGVGGKFLKKVGGKSNNLCSSFPSKAFFYFSCYYQFRPHEIQTLAINPNDPCTEKDFNWSNFNQSSTFTDLFLASNSTLTFIPCNSNNYLFNTTHSTSLISEFSLVCSNFNLWAIPFIQMMYSIGLLLACFLTILADKFGRIFPASLAQILIILSFISMSFSVSPVMYAIFNLLLGMFNDFTFYSGLVYVMEITDAEHKGLAGAVYQAFYSFGFIIYCGFGYFVRDWRWLLRCIGGYGLVHLPLRILFLDESPAFLQQKGEYEKCFEILGKIGKRNTQWTQMV